LLPFLFLITAILICMRWHLIVVLIFISLVISDIKHLFVYLLAIHVYSFGKHLFRVFFPTFSQYWAIFCNGVVFLLLSCLSCLYILDFILLSDVWFANIFPHPLGNYFLPVKALSSLCGLFSIWAQALCGRKKWHKQCMHIWINE
jgi:hypothetical protein